ncbi:MAG: sigma-70 family RNA polymerase sigma factor [Patescibacteria group bacterium]|nr:sigma-70 family RNA polymerase sigma factor [Patescibacteria group bacterium]
MAKPDNQSRQTKNARFGIDWSVELAQHDRWLRTVVAARLGEPQAVDEVMQEVAVAAVEQKAPIEDPRKVAPWLYRLAVTQALLYRRRMGRKRKLTGRYADRFRPTLRDTRQPEPLDWLLAEERRALIRQAMTELPGRDAEILMLKYTQQWSYKELAQHMDISESAVEARLHRARKRLRNQLAAKNVIEASP